MLWIFLFYFFELWNPLKECLTIITDSGTKPLKFFLKRAILALKVIATLQMLRENLY